MSVRLVVSAPMPDAVAQRATAEFAAHLSQEKHSTVAEVSRHLADHAARALLVSSRLRLDAAGIASLPDTLRIIATCSVGYDHIDVAAAAARSLVVTNTPEVLTDATADLAFMLLLCACRRAGEYAGIMRDGWRRQFGLNEMLGVQVSGSTVGILGMGRIGRAVASRARGFGMTVLYTDVARLDPLLEQGARYVPTLREMLPHCRILSLHAPGGPGMDGIIDADAIGRLPRGAVLVNAARGKLVDEAALIAALQSGQLAAAGLDVFRNEPDFDTRLAALPNVFLTPHMGSATVATRDAMGFRALDNVAAVLRGDAATDPVTPG